MKRIRKKLAGMTCVYCATAPAVTMDHVFARSFFAQTQRGNLPQVPACDACNNEKAILEHYLATVLLFGGRHPDASRWLVEMGERRLAQNEKIRRDLAASMRYTKIKDAAGLESEVMTLDFDGSRLERLFAFIVRGLAWVHWQVLFDERHAVSVVSLTSVAQQFVTPQFDLRARDRASGNLGNGTFVYEGAQGVNYPELSLWRFGVYGNAQVSGDISEPNEQSLGLFAFTARKEFLESDTFSTRVPALIPPTPQQDAAAFNYLHSGLISPERQSSHQR